MAEEADSNPEGASPSATADPAAWAALSAASREKADAFLEEQKRLAQEQTVLVRLQIKELAHGLELHRMRVRHLSELLKLTFEIALAIAALGVLALVSVAVWNAANANGLVVTSFSVPPSFAQNGVTGDVVADDMTRKIAGVRDAANANSIARSREVQKELDEGIKVEIPETGLSLLDASRLLRSWLGHEHKLSGNLRTAGPGQVALTVALDGGPAATFTGPTSDLEVLEKKAAEYVFQSFDPSNYILYLESQGRHGEEGAAILHLIRIADSPVMLADGYSLWANGRARFSEIRHSPLRVLGLRLRSAPRNCRRTWN